MFISKQLSANSVRAGSTHIYLCVCLVFVEPCFCSRHHCEGGFMWEVLRVRAPVPFLFPWHTTQTPTMSLSTSPGEWLLCPLSLMPVRGAVMQTAIWRHTNTQTLTHSSATFWAHASELTKVSVHAEVLIFSVNHMKEFLSKFQFSLTVSSAAEVDHHCNNLHWLRTCDGVNSWKNFSL